MDEELRVQTGSGGFASALAEALELGPVSMAVAGLLPPSAPEPGRQLVLHALRETPDPRPSLIQRLRRRRPETVIVTAYVYADRTEAYDDADGSLLGTVEELTLAQLVED